MTLSWHTLCITFAKRSRRCFFFPSVFSWSLAILFIFRLLTKAKHLSHSRHQRKRYLRYQFEVLRLFNKCIRFHSAHEYERHFQPLYICTYSSAHTHSVLSFWLFDTNIYFARLPFTISTMKHAVPIHSLSLSLSSSKS